MLLNNDTLVPLGWEKANAFIEKDINISAVGPLSNSISGRQMIKVDYTDVKDFDSYALKHRDIYRNLLTPRRRLAGFILISKII